MFEKLANLINSGLSGMLIAFGILALFCAILYFGIRMLYTVPFFKDLFDGWVKKAKGFYTSFRTKKPFEFKSLIASMVIAAGYYFYFGVLRGLVAEGVRYTEMSPKGFLGSGFVTFMFFYAGHYILVGSGVWFLCIMLKNFYDHKIATEVKKTRGMRGDIDYDYLRENIVMPEWKWIKNKNAEHMALVLGELHEEDGAPVTDPDWYELNALGLHTGVFVVGQVGSGKTASVIYPLLYQILEYKKDDPEKKCGVFLMDSKGDFCYQARAFMRQFDRETDYMEIKLELSDKDYAEIESYRDSIHKWRDMLKDPLCVNRAHIEREIANAEKMLEIIQFMPTYNPIYFPDMDAPALAGKISGAIVNIRGESKSDPFWDQASLELMRWMITALRLVMPKDERGEPYFTLKDVNKYISDVEGLISLLGDELSRLSSEMQILIDTLKGSVNTLDQYSRGVMREVNRIITGDDSFLDDYENITISDANNTSESSLTAEEKARRIRENQAEIERSVNELLHLRQKAQDRDFVNKKQLFEHELLALRDTAIDSIRKNSEIFVNILTSYANDPKYAEQAEFQKSQQLREQLLYLQGGDENLSDSVIITLLDLSRKIAFNTCLFQESTNENNNVMVKAIEELNSIHRRLSKGIENLTIVKQEIERSYQNEIYAKSELIKKMTLAGFGDDLITEVVKSTDIVAVKAKIIGALSSHLGMTVGSREYIIEDQDYEVVIGTVEVEEGDLNEYTEAKREAEKKTVFLTKQLVDTKRRYEVCDSSIRWFNTWKVLSDKVRSVVEKNYSIILSYFEDPKMAEIFCPPSDRLTFPGFKNSIINEGKVLGIRMPIQKYDVLAKLVCTFLKLDFERAMNMRIFQMQEGNVNKERSCAMIIDEYQNFITVGGSSGASGDPEYLAECRQAKAINIFSTQSFQSLKSKVGEDGTELLLTNLRTHIYCTSDDTTSQKAASWIDKEIKLKIRVNIQEGQSDSKYDYVNKTYTGSQTNISESTQKEEREDFIFPPAYFKYLSNFQCIVRPFNGTSPERPKIVYLHPYFSGVYLDENCRESWFHKKNPDGSFYTITNPHLTRLPTLI